MITVIALMQLPASTTLASAKELFEGTASRYRGSPGLVRKYYIFDPKTTIGGGCYLLQDREAADLMFGETWRTFVTQKYGVDPIVSMYESPVIVDNVIGEIQVQA